MDLKKEKLQSIWKINKEKLIFLFCSGLLLFILSIPSEGEKKDSILESLSPTALSGGSVESSLTDAGGTGGETVSELAGLSAGAKSGTDTYEAELERRIRELLTNVDGVGEVDVMVVLKSSEEKVIHVDKSTSVSTTEEKGDGGTSRSIKQQELSESTIMGSQSQEPIIEKELRPEVAGIIVSADGGGSAAVKAEISEAMEALFGLPAHKIKVLKRVKKGV